MILDWVIFQRFGIRSTLPEFWFLVKSCRAKTRNIFMAKMVCYRKYKSFKHSQIPCVIRTQFHSVLIEKDAFSSLISYRISFKSLYCFWNLSQDQIWQIFSFVWTKTLAHQVFGMRTRSSMIFQLDGKFNFYGQFFHEVDSTGQPCSMKSLS